MLAIADIIHTTGVHLLEDDAQDIGYFEYYGRQSHYYHGKHSPDHPSPLHHWQFAVPMIAIGKLLGIAGVAKAMTEEDEPIEQEEKPLFPSII